MRVLKYLALLPLAAFGSTVTIGPLPPSEYADTEVSTRYKDFAPDWDLVKVVRRGLGASDGSVSLVEERKRFVLFVR